MTSPNTHTANAIAAIANRANLVIPEIDFTQHQLENGEVVSTTERVVKDVSQMVPLYSPGWIARLLLGRSLCLRSCTHKDAGYTG